MSSTLYATVIALLVSFYMWAFSLLVSQDVALFAGVVFVAFFLGFTRHKVYQHHGD